MQLEALKVVRDKIYKDLEEKKQELRENWQEETARQIEDLINQYIVFLRIITALQRNPDINRSVR